MLGGGHMSNAPRTVTWALRSGEQKNALRLAPVEDDRAGGRARGDRTPGGQAHVRVAPPDQVPAAFAPLVAIGSCRQWGEGGEGGGWRWAAASGGLPFLPR